MAESQNLYPANVVKYVMRVIPEYCPIGRKLCWASILLSDHEMCEHYLGTEDGRTVKCSAKKTDG